MHKFVVVKISFLSRCADKVSVWIQLLSSSFHWTFGWAKDIRYGPILYGSIGFWVLFNIFRRHLSQNTLSTLGSRPIFLGRSGYQFPKISPKSPTISSCFILLFFTKIQPSLLRFLVISKVDFHDIIPQFFLFGPMFP